MIELLKRLCLLNGTSGDESDIADFIINSVHGVGGIVVQKDNMGNVLAFKKGAATPRKKVMLTAHMDEVGFIVTDIDKDGCLGFAEVGGISPSAVFGRRVVTKSGVFGVIGGKPVHLLSGDEKDVQPKTEDLVIDIGAASKADAEKLVRRGDNFCFTGGFCEFGDNKIRAKALDDRLGCAILIDMLRRDLAYDCVFAFTVQEEIGCRGATAAAYNLEPDICIAVEATTACDVADVSDADKVCALGGGTVVSFMDKGAVYDKELYNLAFETAAANGLKCQTKTKIAGGNDASAIHKSIGGVRTIALSAPCRYIHTPNCVADLGDIAEMRVLAEKLAQISAE